MMTRSGLTLFAVSNALFAAVKARISHANSSFKAISISLSSVTSGTTNRIVSGSAPSVCPGVRPLPIIAYLPRRGKTLHVVVGSIIDDGRLNYKLRISQYLHNVGAYAMK